MFAVQNHRLEGNNFNCFKLGYDRRITMPTPHSLDCVERHHHHFIPIEVINELKEVLETKFHMTEEKVEELVEQIEDALPEMVEEIIPELMEEVLPIIIENLIDNTPEQIIPELIEELVPFVMENLIDNSVEPEELPKVEEEVVPDEPIEEEPEPFVITPSIPPPLPVVEIVPEPVEEIVAEPVLETAPEPVEETAPVDDDDTISVRSRQNSEPIPLLVQEYLEKAGLSTLKKLNLKVSQKIDISKKKK
jgi:hypothetical protein